MHSLARDGTVIRVNRRWTETLGYESREVLGRRSVDFLTEESRRRAVDQMLPLFWRTGRARGIGYRFVTIDQRPVDLLLDANVKPSIDGTKAGYAALYRMGDRAQWQEASKTLRILERLANLQLKYEKALLPQRIEASKTARGTTTLSEQHLDEDAGGVVAAFLELAQDTSASIRSIARSQQDLADSTEEHRTELLLVLRSIDRNLREMGDEFGRGALGVQVRSMSGRCRASGAAWVLLSGQQRAA